MYKNLQAIVLAAGKSSRFNTNQSKLLEKICGREMILYTTKLLSQMEISATIVVGYQKEAVQELIKKNHENSELNNIDFVHQKEQLGTGHAVMCTQDNWKKQYILIMNGDCPLINLEILTNLFQKHVTENAQLSFVTAHNIDPSVKSYGKVVGEGKNIRIVEAKDATTEEEKEACCVNAGIYLINKDFLEDAINKLNKSKVTGELYITDLISMACDTGNKVETVSAPFDLIRGINTLQELWAAEQIKKSELLKYWMDKGIRFESAQNNQIDLNVTIGSGTSIGSGVHLYGNTKIGKNCKIEAFSILENAVLEDNVNIKSHTIIKNSHIKNNAIVGPFAHIHSESIISEYSVIGNFVEIKKSNVGTQTKIKHLSYIGDSQIGNEVNIGAGTITCNYNGITKEKTVIQDNVSIGSNNCLIAPLNIGKNAYTAAGSVITQDVPDNALAIARSRQINKEDYVMKLKNPDFFVNKKIQKDTASTL